MAYIIGGGGSEPIRRWPAVYLGPVRRRRRYELTPLGSRIDAVVGGYYRAFGTVPPVDKAVMFASAKAGEDLVDERDWESFFRSFDIERWVRARLNERDVAPVYGNPDITSEAHARIASRIQSRDELDVDVGGVSGSAVEIVDGLPRRVIRRPVRPPKVAGTKPAREEKKTLAEETPSEREEISPAEASLAKPGYRASFDNYGVHVFDPIFRPTPKIPYATADDWQYIRRTIFGDSEEGRELADDIKADRLTSRVENYQNVCVMLWSRTGNDKFLRAIDDYEMVPWVIERYKRFLAARALPWAVKYVTSGKPTVVNGYEQRRQKAAYELLNAMGLDADSMVSVVAMAISADEEFTAEELKLISGVDPERLSGEQVAKLADIIRRIRGKYNARALMRDYIAARPLGMSEEDAKREFVTYFKDLSPPKLVEEMADERNAGFDEVFRILGGVASAAGSAARFVGEHAIKPAAEAVSMVVPDDVEKAVEKAASFTADIIKDAFSNRYVSLAGKGIYYTAPLSPGTYMVLDRASVTLYSMAKGLFFGDPTDNQLRDDVHGSELDFWSVADWKKAWHDADGKIVFSEIVRDVLVGSGLMTREEADDSVVPDMLGTAIAMGVWLKVGTALDKALARAWKAALTPGFRGVKRLAAMSGIGTRLERHAVSNLILRRLHADVNDPEVVAVMAARAGKKADTIHQLRDEILSEIRLLRMRREYERIGPADFATKHGTVATARVEEYISMHPEPFDNIAKLVAKWGAARAKYLPNERLPVTVKLPSDVTNYRLIRMPTRQALAAVLRGESRMFREQESSALGVPGRPVGVSPSPMELAEYSTSIMARTKGVTVSEAGIKAEVPAIVVNRANGEIVGSTGVDAPLVFALRGGIDEVDVPIVYAEWDEGLGNYRLLDDIPEDAPAPVLPEGPEVDRIAKMPEYSGVWTEPYEPLFESALSGDESFDWKRIVDGAGRFKYRAGEKPEVLAKRKKEGEPTPPVKAARESAEVNPQEIITAIGDGNVIEVMKAGPIRLFGRRTGSRLAKAARIGKEEERVAQFRAALNEHQPSEDSIKMLESLRAMRRRVASGESNMRYEAIEFFGATDDDIENTCRMLVETAKDINSEKDLRELSALLYRLADSVIPKDSIYGFAFWTAMKRIEEVVGRVAEPEEAVSAIGEVKMAIEEVKRHAALTEKAVKGLSDAVDIATSKYMALYSESPAEVMALRSWRTSGGFAYLKAIAKWVAHSRRELDVISESDDMRDVYRALQTLERKRQKFVADIENRFFDGQPPSSRIADDITMSRLRMRAPRSIGEWKKQAADMLGLKTDDHHVDALAALIYANAAYNDSHVDAYLTRVGINMLGVRSPEEVVGPEGLVLYKLAGQLPTEKGNAVAINKFLASLAEDPAAHAYAGDSGLIDEYNSTMVALFAKARQIAESSKEADLAKALVKAGRERAGEWLSGIISDTSKYVEKVLRERGDDYERIREAVAHRKRITPGEVTDDMIREAVAPVFFTNDKTIISVDFATNCPRLAGGMACIYCFNLERLVQAYRRADELSANLGIPYEAALEKSLSSSKVFTLQPMSDVYYFDPKWIKDIPDEFVTFLNERGGLRVFSFADAPPAMVEQELLRLGENWHRFYENARKLFIQFLDAVEERNRMAAEQGRPVLKLKMITKQDWVLDEVAGNPNISVNYSTDFDDEILRDVFGSADEFKKHLRKQIIEHSAGENSLAYANSQLYKVALEKANKYIEGKELTEEEKSELKYLINKMVRASHSLDSYPIKPDNADVLVKAGVVDSLPKNERDFYNGYAQLKKGFSTKVKEMPDSYTVKHWRSAETDKPVSFIGYKTSTKGFAAPKDGKVLPLAHKVAGKYRNFVSHEEVAGQFSVNVAKRVIRMHRPYVVRGASELRKLDVEAVREAGYDGIVYIPKTGKHAECIVFRERNCAGSAHIVESDGKASFNRLVRVLEDRGDEVLIETLDGQIRGVVPRKRLNTAIYNDDFYPARFKEFTDIRDAEKEKLLARYRAGEEPYEGARRIMDDDEYVNGLYEKMLTDPIARMVYSSADSVGRALERIQKAYSIAEKKYGPDYARNIYVRYVSMFGPKEHLRFITDPRLRDQKVVLTQYHGDLMSSPYRSAMAMERLRYDTSLPFSVMSLLPPEERARAKAIMSRATVAAIYSLIEANKPGVSTWKMFVSAKGGYRLTDDAYEWLKRWYGKSVADHYRAHPEEIVRRYSMSTCCETEKCGTCAVCCAIPTSIHKQAQIEPEAAAALAQKLVEGVPIASVTFWADSHIIIRALSGKADPKVIAHELGHIFRRNLNEADDAIAREWAGMKPGERWSVEADERFADAFADYFGEFIETGKLPPRGDSIIVKFRNWLFRLWSALRRSKVETEVMSPEMRRLFERFAEPIRTELRAKRIGTAGYLTRPGTGSLPPFWRNHAEFIASLRPSPRTEWLIKHIYGIEADEATRPIIKAMAMSTDPEEVARYMCDLAEAGHIINPENPALWRYLKFRFLVHPYTSTNPALHALIASHDQVRMRSTFADSDEDIFYFSVMANTHDTGRRSPTEIAAWEGRDKHAIDPFEWAARMYAAVGDENKQRQIWDEWHTELKAIWSRQRQTKVTKAEAALLKLAGLPTSYQNRWNQFQAFLHAYYKLARSPRAIFGHGRAYLPVRTEAGEIKEASRVLPVGTAQRLSMQLESAKAEYREVREQMKELNRELKKALSGYSRKEIAEMKEQIQIDLGIPEQRQKLREARRALREAENEFQTYLLDPEGWVSGQPFFEWQLADGYRHPFDTRLFRIFCAGSRYRAVELANVANYKGALSIDSLVAMYKQVAMAHLGFPVNVVVGDEGLRIMTENNFSLRRVIDALGKRKQLLKKGIIPEEVADDLGAWVSRTSDDFVWIDHTHPKYVEGVNYMIDRTRSDPVYRAYRKMFNDILKEKYGDDERVLSKNRYLEIHRLVMERIEQEMMDADSELGATIRNLLFLTHRIPSEWAANPNLMKKSVPTAFHEVMSGKRSPQDGVPADMAAKWLKDFGDFVWRMESVPAIRNALRLGTGYVTIDDIKNIADKSHLPPVILLVEPYRIGEPFLIPLIGHFREKVVFRIMKAMSTRMRQVLFAQRYAEEVEALRRGGLIKNEGDIMRIAAKRALGYVDAVQYSNDTTVFEDVARNLGPMFLPAYRQYVQYWGKYALTHPYTYGAIRYINEKLPEQVDVGDRMVYVPRVPFGFDLPSISPVFSAPIRAIVYYGRGTELEKIPNLPAMSFTDPRSGVLTRYQTLLQALTGEAGSGLLVPFGFAAPDYMQRRVLQITRGQIYNGLAGLDVSGMSPERAEEEIQRVLSDAANVRTSLLWNFIGRTFMPMTTTYMPEASRNVARASAEIAKATTPEELIAVVKKYPEWLEIQRYYSMSERERAEWLKNPKNLKYVPFITAANTYDEDGRPITYTDFIYALKRGAVTRKSVEQFKNDVYERVATVANSGNFEKDYATTKALYEAERKKASEIALRIAGGKKNEHYRNIMREWEEPLYIDGLFRARGIWATYEEKGIVANPADIWWGLYRKYEGRSLFLDDDVELPYCEYKAGTIVPPKEVPVPGTHPLSDAAKETYWWYRKTSGGTGFFAPNPAETNYAPELYRYARESRFKRLATITQGAAKAIWERSSTELEQAGIKVPKRWDFDRERLNRLYMVMSSGTNAERMKFFGTTDADEMKAIYYKRRDAMVKKYFGSKDIGIADILMRSGLLTRPYYVPFFDKRERSGQMVDEAKKLVDYLSQEYTGNYRQVVARIREFNSQLKDKLPGWRFAREIYREFMRNMYWSVVLATATIYRERLRNSYVPSHKEYRGLTPYSKEGKKYHSMLMDVVSAFVKNEKEEFGETSRFMEEFEMLGGSSLVYSLLDWRR